MLSRETLIRTIIENRSVLKDVYGVESLCLFGSTARGDNTADSDVDILVEMPPQAVLICSLKEYLEQLLNASVDIIRRHAGLSARFIAQISKDVVPVL